MADIFDYDGSEGLEQVRSKFEELGIRTSGVRTEPDDRSGIPQVIVELASEFEESFLILEAYAKKAGGALLHVHRHTRFQYCEAQFNFPGAKSLALLWVQAQKVCALRHHDVPFGSGKK